MSAGTALAGYVAWNRGDPQGTRFMMVGMGLALLAVVIFHAASPR